MSGKRSSFVCAEADNGVKTIAAKTEKQKNRRKVFTMPPLGMCWTSLDSHRNNSPNIGQWKKGLKPRISLRFESGSLSLVFNSQLILHIVSYIGVFSEFLNQTNEIPSKSAFFASMTLFPSSSSPLP